jgi:ABC-type phosphate transport system substrate-binding protein
MIKIPLTFALLLLSLMVALTPTIAHGQASKGSDIAVVVNPETPVSEMSLTDVRKVFLGERQYWNSKMPVVLLVRAPVAKERDVVLRIIYQMSESQFKQFWVAKIFRSEAVSAPKIVYSSDMTSQLVSAVPGAIAFMDAKTVGPGLKLVKIDGRLPGEAGYPLR